ncbi:MAG: CPBP family intramembrane metalloprotease [Blastochloris sp.]|nr:CPBP family intramembrane metalloprotease [Blastochloris sp.]
MHLPFDPQTLADDLCAVQRIYAGFFATLDETSWDKPVKRSGKEWTQHETIAHLCALNGSGLESIKQTLRGEHYIFNGLDDRYAFNAYNRRGIDAHLGLPMQALCSEFLPIHQEAADIARALQPGQAELTARLPLVYIAMLAGPSVAGLLLTGVVDGRAGFRVLRSHLLHWRVGVRWYAVALLTAPLVWLAILVVLSFNSSAFLPGIITAGDPVSLLLIGAATGLLVGCGEELGWTGFAVPRLRRGAGVLTSGLGVGIVWGMWHFPLFVGSAGAAGSLPPAMVLLVQLFSFLPAYRVLMVWVYDHTESLLVVILMHMSLVICTLSLAPAALAGVALVTVNLAVTAVLWLIVGAIGLTNRSRLVRHSPQG